MTAPYPNTDPNTDDDAELALFDVPADAYHEPPTERL